MINIVMNISVDVKQNPCGRLAVASTHAAASPTPSRHPPKETASPAADTPPSASYSAAPRPSGVSRTASISAAGRNSA